MFAVSATMVVTSVGAGVDLMRAYLAQQKLTHVAALTCQYATANSVQATRTAAYGGTGSESTFQTNVTAFLLNAWKLEQVSYSQLTISPIQSTANGPASVTVSANVPTTFMQIANVTSMPVSATSQCYSSAGPVAPPSSTPVVQEGFESAPCGANAVCYIAPNGSLSDNAKVAASPATYSASNGGYVGSHGIKWYITGYCLETDAVGLISSTVPEGSTAAELDCDNGQGTAGNSAISTQKYLEIGNYELRWFYRGRIDYPDYDPVYICGSAASDTSWAADKNTPSFTINNTYRSNQINVYLDPPTANGAPPFHTTLDGAEQLAGSNLIDQCVYSQTWVERSVRIKVLTAGYYWLTFAADGQNDSYGGQLDDIRLCQGTCAGSPQDNFPPSWLAVNNGGSNKLLFEDNFASPVYTANAGGIPANTNGNLNLSTGTSGTSSSGWPSLAASGWATAPQNSVIYDTAGSGAPQGSQDIWLSTPNTGRNRMTGRPFLLVPGFYSLSYYYASEAIFPTLLGSYCGATPAAANMSALTGTGAGYARTSPTTSLTGTFNTNAVAVFMANAQLTSTPIGGGAVNATTSYTNPDSNLADTPPVTTTSTTPTIAPDAINLTSYTPSTTSALLDICGYAPTWQLRTVTFEITKTGTYWLYFSTQMAGSSSYGGGNIDDVKLTALGSPAMLSPPTNPIVVPAAGAQPGSSLYFSSNAFYTIADPVTFPAPLQ